MNQGFAHAPVMVAEVLELLAPLSAGVFVDATIGGGGHAAAILGARSDLHLVGLDRDPAAVVAATDHLAPYGGRFRVVHARFDAITEVAGAAAEMFGQSVIAVLFDLGVSSYQLDTAARGFSYQLSGPLDMRMDPSSGQSAAEFLNSTDETTLTRLLAKHGEERFARRIARFILARRPIDTTMDLAEAVAAAVPVAARRRGHPSRRVFQALRVEVNDELGLLGPALDAAIELLAPGGRLVVLAYHSGEERIVKERFRLAATGGCTCPPLLPCVCGATPTVRLLNRGARLASPAEIALNRRAESVRLRAVERLVPTSGPSAGDA